MNNQFIDAEQLVNYVQIGNGIEASRVINDAKLQGNLGSATNWLSLSKLINSGVLATGDKVMILDAEARRYLYGGFVYQH